MSYAEIAEHCTGLLAERAMHPQEIADHLGTPMGSVQAALHERWEAFRQVAEPGGFRWTCATNRLARAAQRAVVELYAPVVNRPPHPGGPPKGTRKTYAPAALSADTALGRALYALRAGTIEELAAAARCQESTIRQQASKWRAMLEIRKELCPTPSGDRYWRVVHVALKAGA